jgi:cytochrome c553
VKAFARAVAAIAGFVLGWLLGTSRARRDTAPSPLDPTRGAIVRFVVTHPWWTAAGIGSVVAVGAAFVVLSGVMPIKASSGHWPITAKFLDFAKVRSVATHSWGVQAPPLDDESLLLKGAGHYDVGCYPCHGKPGTAVPAVMAAMTPPPPELTARLSRWTPEELFSIVKHGIKFTGMPAWAAQQRDDEVWAVVAFLRRMPDLDAAAYRRLTYGEADLAGTMPDVPAAGEAPPPHAVRDVCWRCHGTDGTGRGPGVFPSLAGQRSDYVYGALRAFRERTRFSGIMSAVAATLSDEAMREIATYYERLPPRRAATRDAASDRGAEIAARGIPDRDIPACAECHGPSAQPKSSAYPKLTGQHVRYLTSQLELLREQRRGGSPNVNLMQVFVHRLRQEEILDVARYYGGGGATLPPRR